MAVTNLAERLITIIYYLNRGDTIHIKELATKFSISDRQIQKDIKLFSSFYNIENLGKQQYRMKKNRKTVNLENRDIEIAMALMKSLQKSALPQMSDYINKALKDDNLYSDIFLFNIDNEILANMEVFYKLLDAIHSQYSCSYIYTKKDDTSKKVYAHPYRIANLSGLWYLLAYDVEAEILKSYHINSISELKVAKENYISNVAVEKIIEEQFSKFDSPWFNGSIKSVILKTTGMAKKYLDRTQPKHIELLSQSEDSSEMRLHYYNDVEALVFVKQWLPDIQIIDNPALDTELKKTLNTFLQNR